MNSTKKLLATAVAASTMAVAAMAPVANAEVSASVGVASTYLWRGADLGSGSPAISGSLDYATGGFNAGVWASSGDGTAGTEYDIYAGYGGEAGDFSYGLTLISYQYPTGSYVETEGSPGNFMEAIVSLGYGPVNFTYYDNIAGDTGGYAASEDYSYVSLDASFGDFTVLFGKHNEAFGDYSHIDLSYAYNENLSFTLSTVVSGDEYDAGGAMVSQDELSDPFFVVSYSLPIGE